MPLQHRVDLNLQQVVSTGIIGEVEGLTVKPESVGVAPADGDPLNVKRAKFIAWSLWRIRQAGIDLRVVEQAETNLRARPLRSTGRTYRLKRIAGEVFEMEVVVRPPWYSKMPASTRVELPSALKIR